MKALSITQPYANWICDGSKTIETRGWSTPYRGRLLICATKQRVFIEGVLQEPMGMAICIVTVAWCRPMTVKDEVAARFPSEEGRWAWGLTDLKVIKPFPVKGWLKIFNVEYEE